MRTRIALLLVGTLFFACPVFAKKAKSAKPSQKEESSASVALPVDDGKVLHSFSRLIGFDPHPTVVDPLGKGSVEVAGRKLSYTIEFLEDWEAKGAAALLKKLGFKIIIFSDERELKSIEFPQKPLDAKTAKKGMVLGAERFENVGFRVVVDDVTLSGKNITGISVSGSLLGYDDAAVASPTIHEGEPTGSPIQETASGEKPPSAIALKIALQLAGKADAMPESAVSGKILLYKKALDALGENPVAPDWANLAQEIQGKMAKLSIEPQEGSSQPVGVAEPAVVASSHKPTAEAQALFDEAQKMLNLGKEPEARDSLRKAVEKDPTYHAAWFLMGKNAFGNSKYAKAKESLEKALALKDDDVNSAVLFFKSCYYLGDCEPGFEKLRAMAKTYSTRMEVRMALAEAYFQASDYTSCEEECLNIVNSFKGGDRVKDLLAKVKEKIK